MSIALRLRKAWTSGLYKIVIISILKYFMCVQKQSVLCNYGFLCSKCFFQLTLSILQFKAFKIFLSFWLHHIWLLIVRLKSPIMQVSLAVFSVLSTYFSTNGRLVLGDTRLEFLCISGELKYFFGLSASFFDIFYQVLFS